MGQGSSKEGSHLCDAVVIDDAETVRRVSIHIIYNLKNYTDFNLHAL